MKRIVITNVKLNYEHDQISFQVTNTHLGKCFGDDSDHWDDEDTGILLRSLECPEFRSSIKSATLFVEGCRSSKDNQVITTTPEWFIKILKAVSNYNKYFAKKTTEKKISDCEGKIVTIDGKKYKLSIVE